MPTWVTSRTFPGLTYVKYSKYRDMTADDLRGAMDHFGGTAEPGEAAKYWEEQGISSAKEAEFEAHVTKGDLMQLCKFALGRLPERSVVLIRNFDTGEEVSANMNMGAGDEPGGCEKQ